MKAPLLHLENFLESRGMKLTRDRRAIINLILSTSDHFDADDLFIKMRLGGSNIAKTTIYRLLPHLLDCQIIQRVPSRAKSDCYEQALGTGHHDHLVCLKCGKMVEFASEKFEQAQTEICEIHGFEPVFHRVHIRGYCRECKESLVYGNASIAAE